MSVVSLIINQSAPRKDGLIASFLSQGTGILNTLFRADSESIALYPVVPASVNGRYWDGTLYSASDVSLTVGDPDLPPTSGGALLTWGANTSDAINFDDSDTDCASKLNALASIASAGGLTATKPGRDGTFILEWNSNGSRALFTADSHTLAPNSNVVVKRLQAGTSSLPEKQLIQFVQAPYIQIAAGAFSAISNPLAVVTLLRAGDSSNKSLYQIALDSSVYAGSFAINSSDGTGSSVTFTQTSGVSASDVESSMAGTWNCTRVDDRTFTVERSTVGTATINTSTGVVTSSLLAYAGVTGTLDVNLASLWAKFAAIDDDFFTTTVQVKVGTQTIYYAANVPIYRDILNGDASASLLVDSLRVQGVALTSGVTTGSVTFPSTMSAAPIVTPVVRTPTGEGPGFAGVVGNTRTTGFDYVLLGAPVSSNWKLDYIALIPS